MGYDTFGLFRGWCRERPSCLEYQPSSDPTSPYGTHGLRCATCGCLPQQHVPARREGYDPHSEEQLALRRQCDVTLLPPAEQAAKHKAAADDAFKKKNYRTAYEGYTAALAATPDDAVLLGNRCQAYLRVGRLEPALTDAEAAVGLRPDWSKAHYRLGSCLSRLERHEEAAGAFERACELEPAAESRKALEGARRSAKAARRLVAEREDAHFQTTERQAEYLKSDAEWDARHRAKREGVIADLGKWGGAPKEEWEAEYEATKQPPANVEYRLLHKPPAAEEEEPRIVEVDGEDDALALESNGDDGDGDGGELQLESNAEAGDARGEGDVTGGAAGDDDEADEVADLAEALERVGLAHELPRAQAACAAISADECEPIESIADIAKLGLAEEVVKRLGYDDEAAGVHLMRLLQGRELLRPGEAGGTLALAPRNYTLVREDGRPHARDNYEPMSFGMQRVHHDAAPEPVWVQTAGGARWMQSASEVTLIAYKVPQALCRGAALRVEIAPRQVLVAPRAGGPPFLFGELERRVDPTCSTWTTDGRVVTLSLCKANHELYDPSKKGVAGDAHWERLFTSDQYVERGMTDADYSDLPEPMRERRRWGEAKHQHTQRQIEFQNTCPLCGKDVRAFCDCRDGLVEYEDYEKPLPKGWKEDGWSTDGFGEYDTSGRLEIKRRPPPQPRPYAGGRPQWATGSAARGAHAAIK